MCSTVSTTVTETPEEAQQQSPHSIPPSPPISPLPGNSTPYSAGPVQFRGQFTPPEYTAFGRLHSGGALPWDQPTSATAAYLQKCYAWERHCIKMRTDSTVRSLTDSVASVKLLLDEAFRLERAHLEHKIVWRRRRKKEPMKVHTPPCSCVHRYELPDSPDDVLHQELAIKWKRIGANSVREAHLEGHHYDLVRRLANQYIFMEGKQLEAYAVENPWLQLRLAHQNCVILAINSHENGSLFLDDRDRRYLREYTEAVVKMNEGYFCRHHLHPSALEVL